MSHWSWKTDKLQHNSNERSSKPSWSSQKSSQSKLADYFWSWLQYRLESRAREASRSVLIGIWQRWRVVAQSNSVFWHWSVMRPYILKGHERPLTQLKWACLLPTPTWHCMPQTVLKAILIRDSSVDFVNGLSTRANDRSSILLQGHMKSNSRKQSYQYCLEGGGNRVGLAFLCRNISPFMLLY